MKPRLLSIAVLSLLLGCTLSRRNALDDTKYPELKPQAQPTTPKVQVATPPSEPPLFFSIGGNFNNPGRYGWTNGMTLKDAIAAAGGFNEYATRKLVIRHWDGSTERFVYKPWVEDPPLKPGDNVYNPKQIF